MTGLRLFNFLWAYLRLQHLVLDSRFLFQTVGKGTRFYITFISRALLASKFLKERLNLIGKVGCGLCVVGSTVIVIHSPEEQLVHGMEELAHKLIDPGMCADRKIIVFFAPFQKLARAFIFNFSYINIRST